MRRNRKALLALTLSAALGLGAALAGCNRSDTADAGNTGADATGDATYTGPPIDETDKGATPYVVPLDAATLQNTNYRTALWTGQYHQLTLMSIPVGGEIGLEVHPAVDQFLRIEAGEGLIHLGDAVDNLTIEQKAPINTAIFIPQGTWHNVTNTGTVELKLYSIYGPANHPKGTIDVDKAAADKREGDAGVGEGTVAAGAKATAGDGANVPLQDYGPGPFATDITAAAMANENYRTALWTGTHNQITLMTIPVGGEVGLEVHPAVDQFLRIEDGDAKVQMGPAKDNLDFEQAAPNNSGIFVPAGTWHNIINTGSTPLRLYSLYSPPNHPHGTVDVDKAAADAREAAAGQS